LYSRGTVSTLWAKDDGPGVEHGVERSRLLLEIRRENLHCASPGCAPRIAPMTAAKCAAPPVLQIVRDRRW
jgi:hypothetical protein